LKKQSRSPFILISLLCIIEFLGFASYSFEAGDEPIPIANNLDKAGGTIKMVGYVIFCLIIIIAIFFIIIKLISQKNRLMMSGRSIKTIGGVSLGQNKSIQVVEVGHTLFVVGVGENVQLVSKIEDAEEIQFIIEHMHFRGNKDFPTFQSLGNWIKGWRGQKNIEEDDLSTSFQQVFHEKMERISNRKQRVDELFQNDDDSDRLNGK
jgi:flagellar protein FliO/FliZ